MEPLEPGVGEEAEAREPGLEDKNDIKKIRRCPSSNIRDSLQGMRRG